jgi:hypothetical protein
MRGLELIAGGLRGLVRARSTVLPALARACRMTLDGWERSGLSGPATLPCVPISASARTPARSAASADITTAAAAPSEIERHRPRGGKTVGTLPRRCACSGIAVDEVVRRRATPGWGAMGIILVSLTDKVGTRTAPAWIVLHARWSLTSMSLPPKCSRL